MPDGGLRRAIDGGDRPRGHVEVTRNGLTQINAAARLPKKTVSMANRLSTIEVAAIATSASDPDPHHLHV
jgi:hypothetical protein